MAAGNPWFVVLAIKVTGTAAASCTPLRYAPVPSFDPLSIAISSQGSRVWHFSAAMHCRVYSSWFQQGTIIDASPPAALRFMAVTHQGEGRGDLIITESAERQGQYAEESRLETSSLDGKFTTEKCGKEVHHRGTEITERYKTTIYNCY